MLKDYFLDKVKCALKSLISENQLGETKEENIAGLTSEIPKNNQFGDFAVNISSLSRFAKKSPAEIARITAEKIESTEGIDVKVAGGFINFKTDKKILNSIIKEILTFQEKYAENNLGNNEKVILEYVSANPTGPFHIGHGRWAAMGSALANIMKYSGYDVFQEFYINDAGSQIKKLGRSLFIRIKQELGCDISFPQDEEEAKDFYTGDYLIPAAKDFIQEHCDYAQSLKGFDALNDEQLSFISDYARLKMLEMQKKLLSNFNTNFDNFYSELELHKNGDVQKCIDKLESLGKLYEKDGAVWFKSSEYGDDQDRVIKKTDGSYTYLTADIAYHYDKLQRGFSKLINIWGADHHGYVARMRASIEALGYNPDSLEVLLGQLVNLVIKGEQVRMGKRTKMITLDELIEDVGVDATRFWMIMRSIDTTLDFDIELAKSKTDENPVFYVQYAHARACSIIRHAAAERMDMYNKITLNPLINIDELNNTFETITQEQIGVLWSDNDEKSLETTKKLILKLEEYKSIIYTSAKNRTPYLVTKYLQELAAAFHQFYTFSKVLVDNKELMIARLAIVKSVAIILKSALGLISVNAPEKM